MVPIYFGGRQILSCVATTNNQQILQQICEATNLQVEEFYLLQNGKTLPEQAIHNKAGVHIHLRMLGGKGGFGSMLRAIGAQIEKTTNREACRDLSGRRLRDINEEKRLKAWLEKQKDREAEAEQKKKKRVEKLLHVPKHEFKDVQYEEARSKLAEKVNDAVEEGFKKDVEKQNEKPILKRKGKPCSNVKGKKAALWIGADIDGSSTSDSDDSEDSAESNSKTNEKPSTSKEKEYTYGKPNEPKEEPSTSKEESLPVSAK